MDSLLVKNQKTCLIEVIIVIILYLEMLIWFNPAKTGGSPKNSETEGMAYFLLKCLCESLPFEHFLPNCEPCPKVKMAHVGLDGKIKSSMNLRTTYSMYLFYQPN